MSTELISAAHLDALTDEAITIIREVATECENPVLLFSGGKDSAVLLHLAVLAFAPARLPFPVMHIDTGHNFDEVIAYRDALVKDWGVRLVVASVQLPSQGLNGVRKREGVMSAFIRIGEANEPG